jgi:SAM-dependent methyltransferase
VDNSFDLIIAESVISFTTIAKTLNELSRVLKSGGRLILIEMTAEQSLSEEVHSKVSSLYGIHEVLNEHEWKSKLQQAGFTQIEIIDTPDGFIQTDIHDSNPSEYINADLYDIWDEHDRFITQNHDLIGFRAFRCQVV